MAYYTREQLEKILSDMEAAIPTMKAESTDEGDLVMTFAAMANAAGRDVCDADAAWFVEQLSVIQHRHGIGV